MKKKLTQKEMVLNFIRHYKYVRTSAVIHFGIASNCNTADRLARKLRNEGYISRLSPIQKKRYMKKHGIDVCNEEIYKFETYNPKGGIC